MNMQSEGGTSFSAIIFLGEVFQIKLSKTLKKFFFLFLIAIEKHRRRFLNACCPGFGWDIIYSLLHWFRSVFWIQ